MNHHYKVRPKDHAIEAAEVRLRGAHQAKLNNPLAGDEELPALQKEYQEAHEAWRAAHAQPEHFICDSCGKQSDLEGLLLIVFSRIIRQGKWYFDDEREKYLRLCADCDKRLDLIDYPEEK